MPTAGQKSSTGRRVRPHTPTNSTSTTRPTTHPRKPGAGPDSALRTTPDAPMIGAHPPIPCPGLTPHCGQPRRHPSLVRTHESRPRELRIADNCVCTNNGCPPTNHVAGGLVKVNAGDFPSGKTPVENDPLVNAYESRPHETLHCGQHREHQQWVPTHGQCSWRSRKG